MSKLFEIVRPKSLENSDYEEFEYLIRWIGRDGADYQLMFYDIEIQRRTRNEIINSESSTNIEALIFKEEQSITLFADDLSRTDLLVVLQLFGNKFVTRIKKDDSIERYAPDANNYKYRKKAGRYEIEFTLIVSDLTVWN